MKVKVLDCTLRDGGYYSKWDFEDGLVRRYLYAMAKAGIDMVEMGFRADKKSGFAGKYAYCRDANLRELTSQYALELAVMIDGKNFITGDSVDRPALKALFAPQDESPVSLIRITATFDTAQRVGEMADCLSKLGYPVSVNVMRSSTLTEQDVAKVGAVLAQSSAAVAYLADSFGGLLPDETGRKMRVLKESFGRTVGFHAHDNLGLALANSLAAIDVGTDIVDSSVLGMGRGAGNLRTEQLLLVLRERMGEDRFQVSPLFDLVNSDFARLQERYGWGSTLPYMLAGAYDVHPMYPQTLLEYPPRYSPREVIQVLSALHESGKGASFDVKQLGESLKRRSFTGLPMVSVDDLERHRNSLPKLGNAGKRFLIIGAGPSVSARAEDLNAFIRRENPFVLECNHQRAIESPEKHAAVFLNYRRLRQSAADVVKVRNTIILGMDTIEEDLAGILNNVDSYHYPYVIAEEMLAVGESSCTIPEDVVGMYAMAVAIQLGAKEIFLAGFDGYLGQTDGRRNPLSVEHVLAGRGMDAFFRVLRDFPPVRDGTVRVRSLTPTEHDVEMISLYDFV